MYTHRIVIEISRDWTTCWHMTFSRPPPVEVRKSPYIYTCYAWCQGGCGCNAIKEMKSRGQSALLGDTSTCPSSLSSANTKLAHILTVSGPNPESWKNCSIMSVQWVSASLSSVYEIQERNQPTFKMFIANVFCRLLWGWIQYTQVRWEGK